MGSSSAFWQGGTQEAQQAAGGPGVQPGALYCAAGLAYSFFESCLRLLHGPERPKTLIFSGPWVSVCLGANLTGPVRALVVQSPPS